jgi:hypothetical protein
MRRIHTSPNGLVTGVLLLFPITLQRTGYSANVALVDVRSRAEPLNPNTQAQLPTRGSR